ncbi:MAG: hypothetical protein K6F33_09435 [Bacteroidales bacterium]|nr:hypothetical protein [Bacteroidales bacterium]
MKKLISTVASLMLIAVLIVACGSSKVSQLKDAETKGDVKTVYEISTSIINDYKNSTAEEILAAFLSVENLDSDALEAKGIKLTDEEANKMMLTIADALKKAKAENAEAFKKASEEYKTKHPDDQMTLDSFIDLAETIKKMENNQ